MFTIILFYKYVTISDPKAVMKIQRQWAEELHLKGRILIAHEGINTTLEGLDSNIEEYIKRVNTVELFTDIYYKKSVGNGNSFPKLQVKVRDEIVATHIEDRDLGPLGGLSGNYLKASELENWYETNKDFVVIDMRNFYEYEVGRFKNSLIPKSLKNFRDLHKIIPEIEHLKDKTVVTVCTGGVRCEKASGFLIKNGFTDVHQLHNGIHTYMEQYPNKNFEGKLYVFDQRKLWVPEHSHENSSVIGKCRLCNSASENMIDWYDGAEREQGIICQDCIAKGLITPDTKGSHYSLAKH